jgi:membrane protein
MAVPKIARVISQFWRQLKHSVFEFDERRAHGWLSIMAGAANQAMKPDSVISAAAIAYFAVFSLFPFTLLSIAAASFTLGSLIDQHLIVQRLEFIAPALGQLVGQNIDEIIRARGPVSIIAFVSLIWSSSTFFYVLTGTLNVIWGIGRGHRVWKRRGLSIIYVLVFIGPVLVLASFVDNITANLLTWMPDHIIRIFSSTSFGFVILLDIGLFMVVYLMLPHAGSSWRELLPGAFAAGLLWELAKKTFLFFISTYISFSNLIYGSVAALIAILTWAYLSGLIFLFGAYLNVAYYRVKKERQEAAALIKLSSEESLGEQSG